jgi:5'-3' exonuclease
MGIKHLLPHFPGGSVNDRRQNFSTITSLVGSSNTPIDIDCGSLVYSCVLRCQDEYLAGNLLPAVAEFFRRVMYFIHILKWNARFVFDGMSPAEKRHEHARRSARDDAIVVSSTMTAMCAKVCQQHLIPFVVAPQEADMQVRRQNPSSLVVCSDSDALAYGAEGVIIVDRFGSELFRHIDTTIPVTGEIERKYPLYASFKKYGIQILHWWAAVMGCDISENGNGIDGIGKSTFLKVAQEFYSGDVADISAEQFATKLLGNSNAAAKSKHTIASVVAELDRVANWYTSGGCYYNEVGDAISLGGGIIERSHATTMAHMKGQLDPKKKMPFTAEQQASIDAVVPHNMLHSSKEESSKIGGFALPEGRTSVDNCSKKELKEMLIARGSSVVGKDGKELRIDEMRHRLKHFLLIEKHRPSQTVLFDRSRSNGIFSNIDTGHKRTIPQTVLFDSIACPCQVRPAGIFW